jgi:hypothetical protein
MSAVVPARHPCVAIAITPVPAKPTIAFVAERSCAVDIAASVLRRRCDHAQQGWPVDERHREITIDAVACASAMSALAGRME